MLLTKGNKLWRSDNIMEKGFGLLRVVSCGKVNICWKLVKAKDYLVRFVKTHLSADFLSSVIRVVLCYRRR